MDISVTGIIEKAMNHLVEQMKEALQRGEYNLI